MAGRGDSPHTLNWGRAVPGLSCSCVESRGRRVGAESWSLQRLTKGSGSWAQRPQPPTLVTQALTGGCNPCSFSVPRTLDLHPRGARLRLRAGPPPEMLQLGPSWLLWPSGPCGLL